MKRMLLNALAGTTSGVMTLPEPACFSNAALGGRRVPQQDICYCPYYHSNADRQISGGHMSDKTLRHIIASAIAMLLIFQIGTLISGVFGMVWGTVSAVVVAAVSFFSARLAKAGGKGSLWFLLPTLVFTLIPIALMIWRGITQDANWQDMLIRLAPFTVGFGAPVILLLLAYYELRKRDIKG
jgi:hypothetical protein